MTMGAWSDADRMRDLAHGAARQVLGPTAQASARRDPLGDRVVVRVRRGSEARETSVWFSDVDTVSGGLAGAVLEAVELLAWSLWRPVFRIGTQGRRRLAR